LSHEIAFIAGVTLTDDRFPGGRVADVHAFGQLRERCGRQIAEHRRGFDEAADAMRFAAASSSGRA